MQFSEFASRAQALEALAATLIARVSADLAASGQASLLLPGGSSPQQLLPYLANSAVDWPRVRATPTDERWVPADAPQSNLLMLRSGLPEAQWLDPRQGDSSDLSAQRWAEQLQTWLPFSAVLLGMGEDGHFASLFPGMPNIAQALDPLQPPGALLGTAAQAPHQRLSLNLSLLLNSHGLGLLVFGESKRELLEQVQRDTAASRALPVHRLFWQQALPLRLYWAP